ncbi:MAG TPA: glycosyltransferase [Gaiellaceae bacterium]|nr:glycosyltransferase [Gaiellaceae bacterium]
MTVVGVRAAASLGVSRYCDRLQDALAAVGVDYRPAGRAHGGLRTHWHFANSSRGPLWQALPPRRPLLVTVHDVRPRARVLEAAYRLAVHPLVYRRAGAIIVHSRLAADMLVADARVPATKIRVVPHPVPQLPALRRADARRRLGWDEDRPIAVLPGVLKQAKLVRETLAAAGPLVRGGRWRLAFVGHVPDARLARAVHAAGALLANDPDDATYEHALLAADAVLVLRAGSVGESNGPLLDALGAGRAVLATATGSIPEVAADAALFCEPDAASIRRGLVALEDRSVRRELEERARARAAGLSWEASARLHAGLFSEVFGE